jgi:hypothetical protein
MRLLASLCVIVLALSACDAPQPQIIAGVTLGAAGRTGGASGSAGIQFLGGDGSSLDQALLIRGARGERDGIQSEYDWLAANRPGWRAIAQSLVVNGSRKYDVFHIAKGSQTADLFFDITEYFGKF